MKIRLLGTELKLGKGIMLADLFNHISAHGGSPKQLGGYNRYMYIDKLEGYHVGLLITTKDHKRFIEFFSDPANVKLEARDVSKGAHLADFNFFAIDEKTGKGVYQYYHNSCSLNMFGMLCRHHYEQLKGARLQAAKMNKKLTHAQEKSVNSQYAGSLQWEMVVRKEKFDQLIKELKSINTVTLAVSTLAYEKTEFTPMSHLANKMTQRYTFTKGTKIRSVVNGLLKVVSKADIENAKVEGIDEDGLERIIKLSNTPDFFGEYDFDKVAEAMTIAPAQFVDSPFLKTLIKVAKEAKALQKHA